MSAKIKKLYLQMAKHTAPVCGSECGHSANRCCEAMYCDFTVKYAKERWGVDLSKTDHPTLPLMGPNGCTAEPHLRPICTVHVCCINSLGFKPNDPAWTKRYFKLRDQINRLEVEDLDDLVSRAP